MRQPRTVLVTGASGALGKRFVRERLRMTEQKLVLLIRPKGVVSAESRIRKMLAADGLDHLMGDRVEVIEGDITQTSLGLGDDERDRLREEVDDFYHIAALTALNAEDGRSRRFNVEGTAEALRVAGDLAGKGRLDRFFYYSTAYVAGSNRAVHAREDELVPDPVHANAYEATKYEAEGMVRRAMGDGLPVTIFRPSIVVGDSRTGEVSEFNVIYPLMKLCAHGILTTLPARPDACFNIVPIDFVIEAADVIAGREDSKGQTYHLVSEQPPTVETILKVKDVEFPSMPHIDLEDPGEFAARVSLGPAADLYRAIEPYLCYLDCRLSFDTANTRQALEGSGVDLPRTDYAFLTTILKYAVARGYLLA